MEPVASLKQPRKSYLKLKNREAKQSLMEVRSLIEMVQRAWLMMRWRRGVELIF